MAWRSALALGGAVLLAVVVLSGVERLAAGRIEAARAARLAARLVDVLPDAAFDNDPGRDRLPVAATARDAGGPHAVYRARLGDRPVGAALSVVAPDGYSGPIELLVGVDAQGRIVAVRAGEHRETPGLGDRIERRRSGWITAFDGRVVDPDSPATWRVARGGDGRKGSGTTDREGGRADAGNRRGEATFDALTGATITSRAVVRAVHRALLWFGTHRDEAFGP